MSIGVYVGFSNILDFNVSSTVGLVQLVCVWRRERWMGGVDMDQEAGDRHSWSVFGGVGTWVGGVDSRWRLRLRVDVIESWRGGSNCHGFGGMGHVSAYTRCCWLGGAANWTGGVNF